MADRGDYTARRAAIGDKGPNSQIPARRVRSLQVWVELGLQTARRLVVIPVLMLILSAAAAFVSGIVLLIAALGHIMRHALPAGSQSGPLLILEAFLVGGALIIAGAGLYQLFVSETWIEALRRHLPRWLIIRDLADFSARMIPMLALIAVGGFASAAAGLHSERSIVILGAAVALVIAALAMLLRFGRDR